MPKRNELLPMPEWLRIAAALAAPPAQAMPVELEVDTRNFWATAASWIRNNYQDYDNISGLCDALIGYGNTCGIAKSGSILDGFSRAIMICRNHAVAIDMGGNEYVRYADAMVCADLLRREYACLYRALYPDTAAPSSQEREDKDGH